MKRFINLSLIAGLLAVCCSTTVNAQSVKTEKQKKECCEKHQKKECCDSQQKKDCCDKKADEKKGCSADCKKCTECKETCSTTGCKDCTHKGQCKKNCKK